MVVNSEVVPIQEIQSSSEKIVSGSDTTSSEIEAGTASVSATSTKKGISSSGLSAAQKSAAASAATEPTMSQIEKVYNATSSCRGNDEIVKLTGLPLSTVSSCVTWLVKQGWIVVDANKRNCSLDAINKMKKGFTKICEFCADK